MKKKFLKKVILTAMMVSVVDTVNPLEVQAAWKQNSNNQWSWTENSTKATGWKLINNKWYSFNNDGIMCTGWFKDTDSKWYYLMPSGEMKTGWLFDGSWYHLSNSGAMTTGWFKDSNSKWYYLSESGAMKTGWLTLNDKKYYLNSDGAMFTGKVTIEGKEYVFAESGELTKESSITIPEVENKDEVNDKEEENFEVKTAYVITESSSLNLRQTPSASGKILGQLSRGSEVKITGKEVNGFFPITSGSLTGWASSSWIGPAKPEDKPSVNNGNISTENNNGPAEDVLVKPDFSNFTPRTSAPDTKNLFYYSDSNVFYKARYSPPFYRDGKQIIGNCTWYAWGRAWEISGKAPVDAGFVGNAYEWWEANKRSGKYNYGSTPKKGAIAVWKPSMNSSGLGHVAIVEKIENNKVYISESAWQGVLFKYRELYLAEHLYGYIYLDEPKK